VTPDFSPDTPHEQKVLDSVLTAKRRKRRLLTTASAKEYTDAFLPADTYSTNSPPGSARHTDAGPSAPLVWAGDR
jgi:hypothetical protein